jgi:hypothetical protein
LDAGTDADATTTGDASAPCVEAVVDASNAICVSPAGTDNPNCGSDMQPCLSIAKGLERAELVGRRLVYLDTGTYAESVSLLAGLTLKGGWNNVGGAWSNQCKPTRSSSAVIASPTPIGVLAEYLGDATLDTLTVRTKPNAAPGESTYGVFARGAQTRLALTGVEVVAAAAGSGASGNAGTTPEARTGTCAVGSGLNGAAAPVALGGATGTFSAAGYTPGDGPMGESGMAGENGVAPAGECIECVTQCALSLGTCVPTMTAQVCPMWGGSGCGGSPGTGGEGGRGGGSSIAVFISEATVRIDAGRLEAGTAGAGGKGGEPGVAGAPSAGAASSEGPACGRCGQYNVPTGEQVCYFMATTGPTGGVAGSGGAGGSGARGGEGAAGTSYAVWSSAGATLQLSPATVLVHAAPTPANGSGAAGLSGDVSP